MSKKKPGSAAELLKSFENPSSNETDKVDEMQQNQSDADEEVTLQPENVSERPACVKKIVAR